MDTSTEIPRGRRTGWIAFLAALALFAVTAAPSIVPGDGPELTAAACFLGVPHPSGYPLYTLLGRLFCLVPAGSVALRMNLFAALAGAGAAGLLAGWLRRSGAGRPAAWIAAAAVATGFAFWRESTSAEVYGLSALFLALLLQLLPESPGRRRWLLAAYVWGLALTNHVALALVAPAWLIQAARRGRPSARTLAASAVFFLAGLTPYLVLPVRAALRPPWNWGDPSTAERLVAHITGEGYWGYFGGGGASRILEWTAALSRQMSPLVWIALPIGFFLLRRRRKDLLLLVLGGALLSLGYTFHFGIHDPEAYFLPVYILFALPFAFAVDGAARRFGPSALAVAALVVGFQTVRNAPVHHLRGPGILPRYVEDVLAAIEEGGALVVEGDAETFGLLYKTMVENERVDVTLWNPVLDILPEGPLFRAVPPAGRGPRWKAETLRRAIAAGRPVYAVVESDPLRPPGARLEPWGILYRYLPSRGGPPDRRNELWERIDARGFPEAGGGEGYLARIIAAAYPLQKARHRLLRGEREEAFSLLEEASRIGEDLAPVLNNVALAYRRAGELGRARALLERAEENASDLLPVLNLARIDREEGRLGEAEERLGRVAKEDRRLRYSALLELGDLLLDTGRPEEAEEAFREAEIDRPGETAPILGIARSLIERGNLARAAPEIRRAEHIRPGMIHVGDYLVADWRERTGDYEEAERIYRALAGDPPRDAEALRLLALLRAERGAPEEAESLFAEARSLDPGNPETDNAEAWALYRSGADPERALRLARLARRRDRKNPSYADTEGAVLLALGRPAEAAESLAEAFRLGLRSAGGRYRLGLALARSGRPEEGAAHLRTALALDPDSPHAGEARKTLSE